MNKNSETAEITPEIQTVVNRWINFARANDIRVEKDLYWFKTCAELNGGCICKPKTRPICPCGECLSEINKNGRCFCNIFKSHEYAKTHSW